MVSPAVPHFPLELFCFHLFSPVAPHPSPLFSPPVSRAFPVFPSKGHQRFSGEDTMEPWGRPCSIAEKHSHLSPPLTHFYTFPNLIAVIWAVFRHFLHTSTIIGVIVQSSYSTTIMSEQRGPSTRKSSRTMLSPKRQRMNPPSTFQPPLSPPPTHPAALGQSSQSFLVLVRSISWWAT